MSRTWRAALVCSMLALVVIGAPGAALAADAGGVANTVADNGYYLDPGVSVSESAVSGFVADVRNKGEVLQVVVLNEDPPGGATTFADAVFARLDTGLVLVLTPDSVGVSGFGEVYTADDVNAALDFAVNEGGNDATFLGNFVDRLVGAGSASGGGSGNGLLVLLVLVGLAVVFVVFVMRRSSKRDNEAAAKRIEEARATVQTQLDAVANDILDLADEVRLAENETASDYYEKASQTYSELTDVFPKAATAQALLGISERLDEAIWQLDAAEAILDGKPVPPKPEKKVPVPEPQRVPTAPPPAPGLPSSPGYERRPSRRSSYVGPGMVDILIGAAGAMMSNRRRSGRRAGGVFSGGPIFPSRGSSGSSRPTTRSSSRGSGSKIRTGRRRR